MDDEIKVSPNAETIIRHMSNEELAVGIRKLSEDFFTDDNPTAIIAGMVLKEAARRITNG